MQEQTKKDPDQKLTNYLSVFDAQDINQECFRRTAVKPLYDYFQTVLYEVAWRFFNQDRNCLRNQGLEARWNMLLNIPGGLVEVEKWNTLIQEVQKMRARVEHNDDYDPNKNTLITFRKEIVDFANWIIDCGNKYYRQKKNLSFVESYLNSVSWYISQAEWFISEFGEETPYCAKLDIDAEEYQEIKKIKDKMSRRSSEIKTAEDVTKEDFDDLVRLIKQIERIDAKETALLHFSICPKCGDKIAESSQYVGGGYDSEPTAIVYRVGCQKCNYEVNNETIDI
jgi:hypothetical protein